LADAWGEEEPGLRGGGAGRGVRDDVIIVVCDQLLDVRQLLVEIFTTLLLFPVAWELLQGGDREHGIISYQVFS